MPSNDLVNPDPGPLTLPERRARIRHYAGIRTDARLISIHANAEGAGTRGGSWGKAGGVVVWVRPEHPTDLAKRIVDNLAAATGLRNRGVKVGKMAVLKNDLPGMIVECGFMTNKKEALLLASDSYRETVTEAIAEVAIQEGDQ